MKRDPDSFQAEAPRVAFSEDRHERLLRSLEQAPARQVDVTLRRHTPYAAIAVAVLAATAIVSVFMTSRADRASPLAGRMGGPVLRVERAIVEVQSVADRLPSSTDPLVEPTAQVVRFFADQVAIARALAPAPRPPA